MTREEMQALMERQRAYFRSGRTLPVERRMESLRRLKAALKAREEEVYAALGADLGKGRAESYMCEVGMVYSELDYMLSHVKKFSQEKKVRTPLAQAVSRSYVKPSPRGVVLIMSPWNYPLMLGLDPLVDALAAGNTAVVKPSAYAPRTGELLRTIAEETFDPGLVTVVLGGRAENEGLLEQPFDYIFFTGSQAVGREVLRHAAERLTPVALELGGKSPCLVDRTADLALAARRIVFGKFLNCGQTCVAPDYVYCDAFVRDELVECLKKEIVRQLGPAPLGNPDYGHIVNLKHFERLQGLLSAGGVAFGGGVDRPALRMEPTLLSPCTWEHPAMGEEIFGPILPILTYETLPEAVEQIEARSHPLAFYLFSEDRGTVEDLMERCTFGGGCVNDTIIHLATSRMGFGGVGGSGMGAYHGQRGFEAFSHRKSIVDKKTWLDLPLRYQPYTPRKQKLVQFFLR